MGVITMLMFSGQIVFYLIFLCVYGLCCGVGLILRYLVRQKKKNIISGSVLVLAIMSSVVGWLDAGPEAAFGLKLAGSVTVLLVYGIFVVLCSICVWFGQSLATRSDSAWARNADVLLGSFVCAYATLVVVFVAQLGYLGV